MAYDGDKTINGLDPIDNVTLETEIVVWDEADEEAKKGTVQQLKDVIAEGVSAGVAYKGTRAGYETAKLIPAGEEGFIPDSSLVIITDENRTYVTSGTGAKQTISLVARVMTAGDGITITNDDAIKADTVIFTGTRAEWEALSTAQKAKFNIVNITDEELTEDAITDTVEVGNMKAVTSNAVANAINNHIKSVAVSASTDSGGNAYLGYDFAHIIPIAFVPINYGTELVYWQFATYGNNVYIRCNRTNSTIEGTLYYLEH